MWAKREPVSGWIPVSVGGETFYIIPPTSPDFSIAVLSNPEGAGYLELLKRIPEVASLSLLLAQLAGDGMGESRWRVNMAKLGAMGVAGAEAEGLRDTG